MQMSMAGSAASPLRAFLRTESGSARVLLGEDLTLDDLAGYAERLGLDVDRFRADLARHPHAARVARDVDSADRSGVAGTPTFFINDRRHDGPQDLPTLTHAIAEARIQTAALAV